jgi:DNA-binding NarL/FixJ family response regulator
MTISVLIADDHAVVRDGLKALLEYNGSVQVIAEAADGREAVAKTAAYNPQVVVMDIAMPELNGLEAAAQIRVQNPQVQVVMLSMYANVEYIYRALQAGAVGYVLKESAGKEVLKAVEAASRGKPYLSSKITDSMMINLSRMQNDPIESLSSREREVLQLTVEGKTSLEIATVLLLSPKTVETYRSRLMKKLNLDSLPALVKFAILHGLTSLED